MGVLPFGVNTNVNTFQYGIISQRVGYLKTSSSQKYLRTVKQRSKLSAIFVNSPSQMTVIARIRSKEVTVQMKKNEKHTISDLLSHYTYN